MSKKLGIFLAGGVIGAAAAFLCAPCTGKETRAVVAEKVNGAWGQAQEFGAQAQVKGQQAVQTATTKGQDIAQGVAAKGQEFYSAASSRVQEVAGNIKPAFTEKNDDLREKIEAARKRIAAQVAKNAEESQDVASDTIEVSEVATADVPEATSAVEAVVEVAKDASGAEA